jgi:hypothetical protein
MSTISVLKTWTPIPELSVTLDINDTLKYIIGIGKFGRVLDSSSRLIELQGHHRMSVIWYLVLGSEITWPIVGSFIYRTSEENGEI